MTAAELIEKLQAADPSAKVYVISAVGVLTEAVKVRAMADSSADPAGVFVSDW